ncbi:MAG: hypothetical protein ACYCPQ_08085 [Elusimicrobiota bacterium]
MNHDFITERATAVNACVPKKRELPGLMIVSSLRLCMIISGRQALARLNAARLPLKLQSPGENR